MFRFVLIPVIFATMAAVASSQPADDQHHTINDQTPVSMGYMIGGLAAAMGFAWWARGQKDQLAKKIGQGQAALAAELAKNHAATQLAIANLEANNELRFNRIEDTVEHLECVKENRCRRDNAGV